MKRGERKKKNKKKKRKTTKKGMETICVWRCMGIFMDCYGFIWVLVCSISRV